MKKILPVIFFLGCLILVGCDGASSETEQSSQKELLLYCGAGIRPPVDDLVEAFYKESGIRVMPDYAGSEVLLSKKSR